ncbi:hypothetical protein TL16_g10794 [Triparma laevis f. inornata]|uniref:Uncharacterized protein n=1 Tax=Triparma laevis f. inornata TaxID=1714386 RepID=A0A9W7BGI3_9STRA|nr:hypothetical protein TL16_g10794 [Triparma laevis f. inornata]
MVDVVKLTVTFAWEYSKDKKKFQKRFGTGIVYVGDDDEFWISGAGSAENQAKAKKKKIPTTIFDGLQDKVHKKTGELIAGQVLKVSGLEEGE